jgi:hypothetical protein
MVTSLDSDFLRALFLGDFGMVLGTKWLKRILSRANALRQLQ